MTEQRHGDFLRGLAESANLDTDEANRLDQLANVVDEAEDFLIEIADFRETCEQEEYTDVGDVWELLGDVEHRLQKALGQPEEAQS